MVKQKKISVLMAVYNTNFNYTKRAIDSVLKQDFQDFELIIIDDGSKENNRESLLEYAKTSKLNLKNVNTRKFLDSAVLVHRILADFIHVSN